MAWMFYWLTLRLIAEHAYADGCTDTLQLNEDSLSSSSLCTTISPGQSDLRLDRQRQGDRENNQEREKERKIKRERERERDSERQKKRERERQRERERE